jgi:hypothetical protein
MGYFTHDCVMGYFINVPRLSHGLFHLQAHNCVMGYFINVPRLSHGLFHLQAHD